MNERSFIEILMTDETTRRGEQTRSDIVEAAHDLFLQQGYHGTSMRQIAEKTGIALGGLYNHFNGKGDVFHEVLLTYHPYREVIPAILNSEGETVEEFISNAIHTLMRELKERPDFLNLMFIEIVEFKSAHVAELFDRIVPQAFQIIEKIKKLDTGRLRDIEPFLLVRIFVSLFLGYYLTEIAFGPHLPPEFSHGAEGKFIDVLLHGIVAPEGL